MAPDIIEVTRIARIAVQVQRQVTLGAQENTGTALAAAVYQTLTDLIACGWTVELRGTDHVLVPPGVDNTEAAG